MRQQRYCFKKSNVLAKMSVFLFVFVYSVALSCILFCSVFFCFVSLFVLVLLCNSGNDSRVFVSFLFWFV